MSRFNFNMATLGRYKYGLILTLIFSIAFFFRAYFPYDNVFAGDWVRFQQNDPWYHMRLVENLVNHFPHLMSFDPYGLYPDGQTIGNAPFFDLLLGFFIWVFGAGSPTKGLIETLGAYFPAILGALITIPVYFICKTLFHRIAGLLAALLIAILPGEFMFRTLLGFTDHHAAEILFSTTFMLFLILALKSSRDKGISFGNLRDKDWGNLKKPLLYSVLSGIALAFYLLSWTGGALFLFIIFVFVIIQYVMDHLRGKSTDYLCIAGLPAFIIALLLVAPAAGGYTLWNIQMTSLFIGILALLVLSGTSTLMTRKKLKPFYYPLILAALIGIGIGFFYLIDSSLINSIFDKLSVLSPTGGQATISEAKGLSLDAVWEFFSTGFYLSMISLAVLGYKAITSEKAAEKTLLFVWSLIMVIAAFGQQRFAYYLAVNIAILTAYFSWIILEYVGITEISKGAQGESLADSVVQQKVKERPKSSKKAKRKKAQKRRKEIRVPGLSGPKLAYSLIALIIIFFLVFYPNIGKAVDWAEALRGPSDDWNAALTWMRDNTPEPFPDPDFYYALYDDEMQQESRLRIDLLFKEGTGNPARPDELIVQEQFTAGDNTQTAVQESIYIAQTFIPGEAHPLQFVSIKAYRKGSPGPVQVEIQGVDDNGHPDGDTLTIGTINANELTDDPLGDWYTTSVNSYPLLAGTEYAIVLKCPDGDSENKIGWRCSSVTPEYKDGHYARTIDGGAAWKSYSYPEPAYSVISWWDPGYWITYIGHRIPAANPNGQQGASDAASFLLAQDEVEANTILDKLGSRYAILDSSNAFFTFTEDGHLLGEFHAFIAWAERDQNDFYEVCYTVEGDRPWPVLVYYPAYYQSMCSRLFIFGGEEWTPQEIPVVSFTEEYATDLEGNTIRIKVISDTKTFTVYKDAEEYVTSNPDYQIVGTQFAMSPVPLEKLEHYDLIYKSPTTVLTRGEDITISQVEIFEYFP